jgi:hypothetical protein
MAELHPVVGSSWVVNAATFTQQCSAPQVWRAAFHWGGKWVSQELSRIHLWYCMKLEGAYLFSYPFPVDEERLALSHLNCNFASYKGVNISLR